MNIINFLIILTGVLLNAIAQLLLKAGTNSLGMLGFGRGEIMAQIVKVISEPHILGGLTCYVFSVGIWIIALSQVEVSIAYPMLSVGYVVNAAAAWYLFGETLSQARLAGIAVIIFGVYLVAKS